jgi:hypothetical protein
MGFALFQTLHKFINISYIALFNIRIKCDHDRGDQNFIETFSPIAAGNINVPF